MSEMMLNRRALAAGLTGFSVLGLAAAAPRPSPPSPLEELERRQGGRLGVFVLDVGTGRSLGWRADERFLMCSTFKALAVGAVLARVDAGKERLDRRLAYGPKDLLENSPVTKAHVAEGGLTVLDLCAAAMQVSDNTASNLLLATLGGPGGVTAFARGGGDTVTRLDHNEPVLNTVQGVLSTTTPRAMAHSLQALVLGDRLSGASRARLNGWMTSATTGPRRLRAGLPPAWRLGHKTGTGAHGESNDVGVVHRDRGAPLMISAYYNAPGLDGRARDAVLAEVGRIVAAWARG